MDLLCLFLRPMRNCLSATIAAGHLLTAQIILVALACGCWLAAAQLASLEYTHTRPKTSKQTSNRFVSKIVLDQDGNRLWTCRSRKEITQLNLITGDVEATLTLPETEWLHAIVHSRDGLTSLLCAKSTSHVSATLYREGTIVKREFLDLEHPLEIASVSHDGTVCVCATEDGNLLCWIHDGPEIREFTYRLMLDSVIVAIELNSNGRRMAVTQRNGTISFLDPVTGRADQNELQIESLCSLSNWSDDERLMGIVDFGGRIGVYDVTDGRKVFEHIPSFSRDSEVCYSLCMQISRDSKWLAVTGTGIWGINVWNLQSGQLAGRLCQGNGIIRTIQFSPMSDRLYSGGVDGKIREWSLESYTQLRIVD